jgi:hypothetical protein
MIDQLLTIRKKQLKMFEDLKCLILNAELEHYELKIQHYEHLYEQELAIFQSEIYKRKSLYQICHFNKLMYFVKIYVYHHTELLLRQIRYKESCFHVKLIRHPSFTLTNTIDVYPRIIVDVSKASLNQDQLDYLHMLSLFLLI